MKDGKLLKPINVTKEMGKNKDQQLPTVKERDEAQLSAWQQSSPWWPHSGYEVVGAESRSSSWFGQPCLRSTYKATSRSKECAEAANLIG